MWPDLLVGSANLITCRCVTWWRGRAPRGCPRDELPRQSPFHVPTKPAHAITLCRREGTNWVNRSSAFYNPLRNRKNESCKALMPYQRFQIFSPWEENTHTRWLYFNQKRLLHRRITWVFIQWWKVCEKLTLNLGANHHTKGPLYFWLTEVGTQAISSILAQVLGCMCTFH